MFDLSNIDIIKTDQKRGYSSYSFVGLQRNKETDRLEFWLPLGFDDFDHTDFNLVKGFFFKMYRTFKTYLQRKQNYMQSKDITIDRDGIIENENGFSFINENNEQVVFYGKLNSLDKIIEGYDELRISSLEKKQMRSPEIDYSKIHRYMHQAVYLDHDVIYIDEMNIAKNILVKESPPILQLFCFIYTEIKRELEELENISDRAAELAEEFKENYLQPNSSLFGEDTFAETVDILRETLEDLDTKTAYKDDDYWHFFEAVEAFLYGERQEDNKGIYWGFSSFYDIWEDMCQTYVLNTPEYKERAIFADIEGKLKPLINVTLNPFELTLNDLTKIRYLRPDLVLKEKEYGIEDFYKINQRIYRQEKSAYGIFLVNYPSLQANHPKILDKFYELREKETNEQTGKTFSYMFEQNLEKFRLFIINYIRYKSFSFLTIVDYKYMGIWDYERYSPDKNGENKVKDDIQKQLVYEWTIQQNWNAKTESEFWIPYFSNNPLEFEKIPPVKVDNTDFNKSKIKLVEINFKTLQDFYIKQGLV
ncbi:conserved hypothetical protein [Planktothrix serta PCC 8927]|uniref:Uncharacterized protein n=1 Tax=Planktothrix serta PCC 8927 TaxID=671068 RepID=A0A7Z9C0D3_9CYAN|nr:hypothetical protein [Planktothrix serta]VXD24983.1 conserved hypothetical protein [Planktothrix serta PCC 8927]